MELRERAYHYIDDVKNRRKEGKMEKQIVQILC